MWIRNQWVYRRGIWVHNKVCDVNRPVSDQIAEHMLRNWVDDWDVLNVGPDVILWLPRPGREGVRYLATLHQEEVR